MVRVCNEIARTPASSTDSEPKYALPQFGVHHPVAPDPDDPRSACRRRQLETATVAPLAPLTVEQVVQNLVR